LLYFNPLPSQEGRSLDVSNWNTSKVFQSTPFARRETVLGLSFFLSGCVSIHSLRKKGDHEQGETTKNMDPFQSTPFARRETSCAGSVISEQLMFQSTPFARRETFPIHESAIESVVSIHSLRKKGDETLADHVDEVIRFNPLPSQEGRRRI